MWTRLTIGLVMAAMLGLAAFARPAANDARAEFFESRVRPLLINKCSTCHGPKQQQGGLRVDSLAGLLKGGKFGTAIVAGKPEASRLIEAISHTNPNLKMPPTGKLDSGQIEALTLWVKQGAYWPEAAKSDGGSK